jgi:hypothetical protein
MMVSTRARRVYMVHFCQLTRPCLMMLGKYRPRSASAASSRLLGASVDYAGMIAW